jgi:hypothetical protein
MVEEVAWPEGSGEASGPVFWGVLVNRSFEWTIGEIASRRFGNGP